MSNQSQTLSSQAEIKKSPFEQSFLCPKCSEILFTKIYYHEKTNTPQVHYSCPKKHSGVVDLILFFDLFYSSNKEIKEELSKFEEELDKDIEIHRNKKLQEAKLLEEEKKLENISKSKEKENEKEKINEEEKLKNDNNIDIDKENNKEISKELNNKSFKELEKCNNIELTLLNTKKNKIINNKIENIIDSNNIITNNNSNINNNNIIISKKSKEKKEITHKISNNNINIIKKTHSSEKEEKLKEEKFLCDIHNKSHFVAYCNSCKKNICKKCLKSKKHRSKMFKNIKITENNLNELNKLVGQCQESLNKFENQVKLLIRNLNKTEEKNEKLILFLMSNALIDINKDYLNEVKVIIKNYNNCVKNKMLNYEVITSIKNIKLKNNILIPNDKQELIDIISNYKDYLFEKTFSSDVISSNNNKHQLFEIFNSIIKNDLDNNEKGIINFGNILEDEKFRNLINLGELKNDEVSDKNGGEGVDAEIHQVEKIDYDMNDYEEGEEMEELLEEEEEEFAYDDEYEDYEDDINNDEDENNYGDDIYGIKDEEDKEN